MRIIQLGWIFYVFIICACYEAALTSFLTQRKNAEYLYDRFDTMQQDTKSDQLDTIQYDTSTQYNTHTHTPPYFSNMLPKHLDVKNTSRIRIKWLNHISFILQV